MKERLTVVLGAGSLIDLGFPSTEKLTKEFIKRIPFLEIIDGAIREHLSEIRDHVESYPNFEALFYIARVLYDMSRDNPIIRKEYLVIIKKCIEIIKEKIIMAREEYVKKEKEYEWHTEFWKKLVEKYYLDIISLNYDDLFELLIFKDSIISGFNHIADNSYSELNPERLKLHGLFSMPKHRIIRLHGSIHFILPYDLDVNASDNNAESYYYNAGHIYWQYKVTDTTNLSFPVPTMTQKEELVFQRGKPNSTIITGYDN